MMTLDIQIQTFIISILFGLFFSFFVDLIYKQKVINIIFSFVFVIIFTLIYFLTLLKINNAIIHPYYIISFIIGFFLHIVIKKYLKRIVLFKKK